MRVADDVELSWLGQDETAPPKPKPPSVPVPAPLRSVIPPTTAPAGGGKPVGPKVASAIVTIFGDKGQRPAEGITVDVLDENTRVPLNRGVTDKAGRVFFDLEADAYKVLVVAYPPEGYVAMPPEVPRDAYWEPGAAPGPNWLRWDWDWTDSARIRILKESALDRTKQSEEADKENKKTDWTDFITVKNVLITGGIAVAGYLLLKSVGSSD